MLNNNERCGWCGKTKLDKVVLIKGTGVAICHDCVKKADKIIKDKKEQERV